MRPRGNEFGVFPKKIRGSYIFYFWVYEKNGKRRFRSTGKKTIDEAVKFCRTLQIKGQLYNSISLSFDSYTRDFFDYEKCPYIQHRISRGHTYSRSWAKRQQRLLEVVIRPFFSRRSIDSISFQDIDAFIMSLKDQNFSNKKKNHIITTLKNIFNYAEMTGVIQTNPCRGLKPFKINSPEKGILTREELQKLFSEENRDRVWPEKIHFAINYIVAHTGLRLGEVLALRAQDISNDRLIITHSYNPDDGLKSTKNGKKRIIPLRRNLKDLFTDLCDGKQLDEFLFSSNNGLKPICHKLVYKRFWNALDKIGINKEERERRNFSFHSYRHGFNTLLLENGIPPETVRLILGHSGSSMTARYSHIQLPDILPLQDNSTTQNDNGVDHTYVPAYIKQLIDKGLLLSDGKTVAKSLNKVALEMQELNVQPTQKIIKKSFLKKNGKEYSDKACKEAVCFANSK